MIKLIVGSKGSGKTKTLVDMVNSATKTTNGHIVVIEKGMQMTYTIDHNARLIDMDEYKIDSYELLYGFVAGVFAGDYDITELFIDGMMRVGGTDLEALAAVLGRIAAVAGETDVVVTVSADASVLPESLKKYM